MPQNGLTQTFLKNHSKTRQKCIKSKLRARNCTKHQAQLLATVKLELKAFYKNHPYSLLICAMNKLSRQKLTKRANRHHHQYHRRRHVTSSSLMNSSSMSMQVKRTISRDLNFSSLKE